MRIIVDTERVESTLDTLLETYRANEFPYNHPAAVLPQDARHMPARLELGSIDHAMFLFCLCYYMRGGIKSVTGAKYLARLYQRRPKLFEPEFAVRQSEQSIFRSLEGVGLNFRKTTVPEYWIENCQRLLEWYGGDPRKLFAGVDNYEEACRRICNNSKRRPGTGEFTRRQGFLGFQKKMTSMLAYFLVEAGLIEPFPFPIPVDFHVMRVSIATEMVRFEDLPSNRNVYTKELREVLRQVFLEYSIRRRVYVIELSNALWLLSSTACSRHIGNRTLSGKYEARSTALQPYIPRWTDRQIETWLETCGSCPVQEGCCWDVPNGNYTRRGELVLLRQRSKPVAVQLVLIN